MEERIIIETLEYLLSAVKQLRSGTYYDCHVVEGEICDEKLKLAEQNIKGLKIAVKPPKQQ